LFVFFTFISIDFIIFAGIMNTIMIAIDSLKGCLSSEEAGRAAASGVGDALPQAASLVIPVSDGGEGMLAAFGQVMKATTVEVSAHDALMRPIKARYALAADGTAIVEVAEACGLARISPAERDILRATSYGVGEFIADALRRGCRQMVVGLGGTATSDCGRGMLEALKGMDVSDLKVTLASDVRNPLYGEQGAAAVFAPQKGATPEQVKTLDRRARDFARQSAAVMGFDRSRQPGAGAAGGLGYAFLQYFGARMQSGAELLLSWLRFDERLDGVDCVITGEGRADRQTLMGKLPFIIMQHARAKQVPVHLIAGQIADADTLLAAGFTTVRTINPPGLPLTEALKPIVARANIRRTVAQLLASD
jgi:glycerate 2-kinase